MFAKDFYYLTLFLPQGPYTQMIKNIAQSGKVDGGIPDGPRSFFYAYVEKVREALGATNHIPAPKKEPDLVVAIPAQVFAAHDKPEVQEAYLKYLVSRDRYEFEKAGRGAQLNDILAKLRGPVQVSEPTPKRAGYGDIYGTELAYNQVPEDFVPTIDLAKMSGDDKFLSYSMKKDNPGSLIKIKVSTFFYPGLIFTKAMSDAAFSLDPSRANSRRIIFEDAEQIRKEEGALLTCTYVSNSSGTEIVRYFWYKKRVAAAEAGTLRSRLGGHPLLAVRAARDDCPATSAEADGQPPAPKVASLTPNNTAADAEVAAAAAAQKAALEQAQKVRDEQARKAREEADARKKVEDDKLEAQRQQKAALQTFQDEFLTHAKRPDTAFGKAINGVQLGMTMAEADAALRKNMNVKYAAAGVQYPPPGPALRAERIYVNPDFSRVTALYTYPPAASDRVVAVVSWIQLPEPRMTVADAAGELIKAYGEPAGKQGAGNMGWYEEKTACEWPRLEWPVGSVRPPMDQNGTPIWSSYGGNPMKEGEYLAESRKAISMIVAPELPPALATEMRSAPMTKIVCGPGLFAQTVVQGAFLLVLYDKLWFDALYYEAERSTREANRKSVTGILNAK